MAYVVQQGKPQTPVTALEDCRDEFWMRLNNMCICHQNQNMFFTVFLT